MRIYVKQKAQKPKSIPFCSKHNVEASSVCPVKKVFVRKIDFKLFRHRKLTSNDFSNKMSIEEADEIVYLTENVIDSCKIS